MGAQTRKVHFFLSLIVPARGPLHYLSEFFIDLIREFCKHNLESAGYLILSLPVDTKEVEDRGGAAKSKPRFSFAR